MATYEARKKNEERALKGINQKVIPVLRREHFRDVATSARRFDKYLISVEGGKNSAEVALDWKLRDDEFMASDVTENDEEPPKVGRKKRKKKHKKEKRKKREERSRSRIEEESTSSSGSESETERNLKRWAAS
jgi:hypothetical protein